MAASVFIFAFACLLAWLLYRFPLRRATTRAEVGKLALVFAFVGLFFLANALLAYQGRLSLLAAVNTSPISTGQAWAEAENGAGVVLAGLVSAENPLRAGGYVAAIECDDGACTRDAPTGLLVALDGGEAVIGNDDFEARAWPTGAGDALFLAAGQPVVVVGTVERGVILLGPDRGKGTLSIRAEVVFAGSHQAFVARARRSLILPGVMIVVNLLAVAAVVLLPWVGWQRRARRTIQGRREPDGSRRE
jgi:hypothetical protein